MVVVFHGYVLQLSFLHNDVQLVMGPTFTWPGSRSPRSQPARTNQLLHARALRAAAVPGIGWMNPLNKVGRWFSLPLTFILRFFPTPTTASLLKTTGIET